MALAKSRTDNTAFEDAIRTLRGGFVFVAILTAVLCLCQLIVPLFMIQVYDRVLGSRNMDTLAMLVVVSAGGLMLLGSLDYIRSRVYHVLGHRLMRRLQQPTLQAAVDGALEGRTSNPGQALRDLTELRQFITGSAINVPFEAMFTPLFLAVMFLMHPVYGFMALFAAFLLISLSIAMEIVARRPLAEANEAAVKSMGATSAALRNAEVIQAMGMLPAIAGRWEKDQRRVLAGLDEGNQRSRALSATSKTIRYMLQIAMLSIGAILVIQREATPGTMVAASIIMGRMLLPFDQLIEGWRQWVSARGTYRRLRELVGRSETRHAGMSLANPEGRLNVERLTFVPPGADRPVLRNISFSLEPGEVLGVIGPSAAGKSTLARLLVGVWRPTGGAVYLDGQNVVNWDRAAFGRAVGYLPQSVSLLDGSVRDNISHMAPADPAEVVAAARRADVHETIGALPHGYDTEIGEQGYSLSGGQRQRIGLARALFGSPVFMVLDEPNANLDQSGEQALMNALAAAKADGTTIILITHRPSIVGVCDKLLVLREGGMAQFGPRADVLRSVTAASKNDNNAVPGQGGVARLVKS
ncbi:ATP-binding cassette subfamily C protein [Dongia mobilis]|uniref:ATP-binding cassette subfamily C protein n=1 Tax=Dongia mobilis TaxID=578943 RepID=A0A4R6WQF9_9PROT|nr:type I secretion system permease/ATPase [Dongia mobilis]TDQ83375.1 ATP-binding cassette subfamily C protein [Dongia mobilis]